MSEAKISIDTHSYSVWSGAPKEIHLRTECGTKQFVITVDADGALATRETFVAPSGSGTHEEYEKAVADAKRAFEEKNHE